MRKHEGGFEFGTQGLSSDNGSLWAFVLRPTLFLLLLGCPADAPPPPLQLLAPRAVAFADLQSSADTVLGYFSWTAPTGIEFFRVSVIASHGTWLYVITLDRSSTRGMFTARPSVAGDSAAFTVCVKSILGADSSVAACTPAKRPTRPVPPPLRVIWDSLKVANTQETGEYCDTSVSRWWTIPQPVWSIGNCPTGLWVPARFQYLARDKRGYVRTCPAWLDKIGYCEWTLIG